MTPRDTIRLHSTTHNQEPWRSVADVDVDRLLYSPEFRRLSGVTQVVPPQSDFHFHDRLSHSIKVAQVAATLARQLLFQARDDPAFAGIVLNEWVDPQYCYVAGLAHDIGHPPFGHAGEEALQEILDRFGSDDEELWSEDGTAGDPETTDAKRLSQRSFEGNAQSIRVITKLSFRRDPQVPGLNLTLRSLAAIAKYPWLKGGHPANREKLRKKWSFYPEEAEILQRLVDDGLVRADLAGDGTVAKVHRWVEAEIMDWADDISYAVHDVDDFYRAGLIPLAQVANALASARSAVDWATTDFDFVDDDDLRDCLVFVTEKLRRFQEREGLGDTETFRRAFKRVCKFAQDDCPHAPFSGSRKSHASLQAFSGAVIRYLSSGANLAYLEETQRVQLTLDPEAVLVAEFFKALNSYFVIESVTLAALQFGQIEDLYSLFDSLLSMTDEWLGKVSTARGGKLNATRRLPARLRAYLSDEHPNGDADTFVIAVAILDYITSLRDSQAAALATQLRGSGTGQAMAGRWIDA